MRKINKDETPDFWKNYVAHNRAIHYDSADSKKTRELRLHMLEIQGYLCAYCCAAITEKNSHNEHIKPKAGNRYPKLSMDYGNMVVSCTTEGSENMSTCGAHKGDRYNEALFVSPLADDCTEHFRFEQDGRIVGLTEAGSYTIDLLNLNAYRLVSCRKAQMDVLISSSVLGKEYIQQYFIDKQNGRLPSYVDMTEYFMKQGFFD